MIDAKEIGNQKDKKQLLKEKNEQQLKNWSGGMAQKAEQERKWQEIKKMNESENDLFKFNRTDTEYELEQIGRQRFGDNMASLISEDDRAEIF